MVNTQLSLSEGTCIASYSKEQITKQNQSSRHIGIINKYFGEISNLPTLDRKREIELARKIEETYLEYVYRISTLPNAPEMILQWADECRKRKRRWDDVFKIKTRISGKQIKKILPRDREALLNRISQQYDLAKIDLLQLKSSAMRHMFELKCRFHLAIIASYIRDLDPTHEALKEIWENFKFKIKGMKENEKVDEVFYLYTKKQALSKLEEIENAYVRMVAAKNEMIKANLKLVILVGKKFINRGLPYSDILQEGNLGLIKAVDKFDFRKGFRFSTYATWWIQQSINKAIAEQGQTIRVPQYVSEIISKLNRIENNFRHAHFRNPDESEMIERTDEKTNTLINLVQVIRHPYSLQASIKNDDDSNLLIDVVEDPKALSPFDSIKQINMKLKLEEAMRMLPERERLILKMRYGIDSEKTYTLEEIGSIMGLTRERIRQLEQEALLKIKNNNFKEKLTN